MSNEFLKAEQLMRSLSDELLKLKSTIQQYEETRQTMKDLGQSTQEIGQACISLTENTKSLVVRLQQVAFEDNFQKLQDISSELKQQQQEQAKKLKFTQSLLIASILLEAVSVATILLTRR